MCLSQMCWPCFYRAKRVDAPPRTIIINTSLSEIENEVTLDTKMPKKMPKYVNDHLDDRLLREVELNPILNQKLHYPYT